MHYNFSNIRSQGEPPLPNSSCYIELKVRHIAQLSTYIQVLRHNTH